MKQYLHVTSSAVTEAAYDETTQTLFLKFPNGSEYAYEGVPHEEVTALLSAESVGAFFNREIKTQYPFRKVENV